MDQDDVSSGLLSVAVAFLLVAASDATNYVGEEEENAIEIGNATTSTMAASEASNYTEDIFTSSSTTTTTTAAAPTPKYSPVVRRREEGKYCHSVYQL